MSQKLPYFNFYPCDYLADMNVDSMTLEEQGAYMRLLCHSWSHVPAGHLPNDDQILAGLSRLGVEAWKRSRNNILRAFQVTEKWIIQKRIVVEFNKYIEFIKKQSLAGKSSAEKRKLNQRLINHGSTAVQPPPQPDGQPKVNPSTPPAYNNTKKSTVPQETGPVAEIFEFWQKELNHPKAKLDKVRRTAIAARLKANYTVERIKNAVLGNKACPHNKGDNERGTIYDDIELICRSGANVDRFADIYERIAEKKMAALKAQEEYNERIRKATETPAMTEEERKKSREAAEKAKDGLKKKWEGSNG